MTIILQKKEAEAILEDVQNGGPTECKDRFLVASVLIDKAFYDKVVDTRDNNKEMTALLQTMWGSKAKDQFQNKRLGCVFKFPPAVLAKAVSAGNGTSSAPRVASPSRSPKEAQSTQKTGSFNSAREPGERPSGTGAPQAGSGCVHTHMNMLYILGRGSRTHTHTHTHTNRPHCTTNHSSASSAAPGAAATAAGAKTADNWQEKYKELLNLVVQVTDERDRYKTNFKEASKELMALKDQQRSRRGSDADADVVAHVASGGAFAVWHLLLVAIVSFLIARIVA